MTLFRRLFPMRRFIALLSFVCLTSFWNILWPSNLQSPEGVTADVRQNQLRFLEKLNRIQASRYPENTELTARIANFETAARMQTSVPRLLVISQGTDGRDHNRHAFSLWIAGGGFKQGCVYRATDPFGYAAVENIVNVHDLHATLLASLGLNHSRLTVSYDGRDTSLTDTEVTHAKIIEDLFRRTKTATARRRFERRCSPAFASSTCRPSPTI